MDNSYNKKDFIIKKSTRNNKKYMAYYKKDLSKPPIHFGAIKEDGTPYEQYKDITPLKLYSQYDHNDKERKLNYIKRHSKNIKRGFNAGWLSKIFLW